MPERTQQRKQPSASPKAVSPMAGPARATAHPLLQMQKSMGNRAVQRMLAAQLQRANGVAQRVTFEDDQPETKGGSTHMTPDTSPPDDRSFSSRVGEGMAEYAQDVGTGFSRIGERLTGSPERQQEIKAQDQAVWRFVKGIVSHPQQKYQEVSRDLEDFWENDLSEDERSHKNEIFTESAYTYGAKTTGSAIDRLLVGAAIASPITSMLIRRNFQPMQTKWMEFGRKQLMKRFLVAPVVLFPLVAAEMYGKIDNAHASAATLQQKYPKLYARLKAKDNEFAAPFLTSTLEELEHYRKEKEVK